MTSNQVVPIDQFGQIADVFKDAPIDNSRFLAGIGMAWPTFTLKGKSWGWRYRGNEHTYTAPNQAAGGAHMPVQFVDVVIVDAGQRISKVYYKDGYKEGDRTPPSCWSADGITPDGSASDKQSNTCGGCRHNVFGSRVGDGGQRGKACSDNKRLAVVTIDDIENKDFGGPFMMRLPPGSFSNYTSYVSVMQQRGYPVYAVATRLMFDHLSPHPKVVFSPVRPLGREEALVVLAHMKNPRTSEMLNDKSLAAFADPDADPPEAPGAVGALPPTPTSPVPGAATGVWTQPKPDAPKPVMSEIDQLKAQLAALQAAKPEPAPPPPTKPVLPKPTPEQEELLRLKAQVADLQKPLTPEQEELLRLRAQLAEAQAPPKPDPLAIPEHLQRVKTPEQLEIEKLKAQLAEATAKKTRAPRSKPVSPPTEVTQPSNGQGNGVAHDEPAGDPVGNQIADRIASLMGTKTP